MVMILTLPSCLSRVNGLASAIEENIDAIMLCEFILQPNAIGMIFAVGVLAAEDLVVGSVL